MARLYLENDSIPLDIDSITTGDWIKGELSKTAFVIGKVVKRVRGNLDGFVITPYYPRHVSVDFVPIDDVYILGIQGGGR